MEGGIEECSEGMGRWRDIRMDEGRYI